MRGLEITPEDRLWLRRLWPAYLDGKSDVLEQQFARGERERRVPQQCEVDAREEGGELRGAADAEDGDEFVRTAEEE